MNVGINQSGHEEFTVDRKENYNTKNKRVTVLFSR